MKLKQCKQKKKKFSKIKCRDAEIPDEPLLVCVCVKIGDSNNNNQTINQSLQVQANLVYGTCRAGSGEREK